MRAYVWKGRDGKWRCTFDSEHFHTERREDITQPMDQVRILCDRRGRAPRDLRQAMDIARALGMAQSDLQDALTKLGMSLAV